MYLLIYVIGPTIIVFVLQSVLCRKVKKGILRHGALILPMISVAAGIITLLTQQGDIFGGLGVMAAVLWFLNACCMAAGCGAAWFIFSIVKRRKSGEEGA